jgi:hypothetical protein
LDKFDTQLSKDSICEKMMELTLKDPKPFIGIEIEKIKILESFTKFIKKQNSLLIIILILRKIKLNESFRILGHYYGLSESRVSALFHENIETVALCCEQLIFTPPPLTVYRNLPVAFRCNFSNVRELWDCFEIEIEKPSNPVNQALTWSYYKNGNTIKYFIVSTPDGFIKYISKGVGGKTSDLALVQECGYLDTLVEGTVCLADRGFKHLETVLAEKSCKLLRPPSVSANDIPSKEETTFSKQISSLRIHIERVIGRIREFLFLSPHARVDNKLIQFLDKAIVIAAALVNLEKKLIKV